MGYIVKDVKTCAHVKTADMAGTTTNDPITAEAVNNDPNPIMMTEAATSTTLPVVSSVAAITAPIKTWVTETYMDKQVNK